MGYRRRRFASLVAGTAVAAAAALGVRAAEKVYLADPEAFSPREALAEEPAYGKWYLRRVNWSEHSPMLLNLGGTAVVPDLTVAPGLTGRYNVYVGCRQVDWETRFQTRIGEDPLWYTIDPGLGTPQQHTNREILVATDIDMTGQRLTLHAVSGGIYFYYFAFAKAADEGPVAVDPTAVRREPRRGPGDEIDAKLTSGYFVERVFVDGKPMPPLSAADRQAGFVTFSRSTLELVFPASVPEAGELTDRLEFFATPGEYEPVTVAIRALRPLAEVTVQASALVGPAGATIPAEALDVRTVRCLRKRSTMFTGAGEFIQTPILLEKRPSVTMGASETRQFWITVRVPEEAVPGRYTGTVTIRTPEATQELALALEVLPLVLPAEAPGYSLAMYDTWPQGVTPIEDRCRDMRDHGMTTLAWAGDSGLEITLREGKAVAQIEGSRLGRALAAHGSTFARPMLWLMDGSIDAWCQDQAQHGADYASLYGQVITQILDYCRNRGWPGILFQPEDECPSVVANFPRALRQLKALKAIAATTEMDHMAFAYPKRPEIDPMVQEALPLSDVLTLRYSTGPIWYEQTWDDLRALCAGHGKVLWTYNINDALGLPEPTSNRFSTGFFFHTLGKGCTGETYWAYELPCDGLYEDLDGTNTDTLWRYPAWELSGETGGPTIQWECLREGIDDLRYIAALQALIAQARPLKPAAADQAQAVLDAVLGSFRFGEMAEAGCRYLESKWERSLELPDGRRACSGTFRLPNGWQARDYDAARRRIAEAAIALQRELN